MPRVRYTLEHRRFVYDRYMRKKSIKKCCRKFRRNFLDIPVSHKSTIQQLSCFVYKPKTKESKQKKQVKEPWYNAYKRLWSNVETDLETVREKVFSEILENLIVYIQTCCLKDEKEGNEIPSATLLTGVNVPDHDALFMTLSNKLQEKVTPHVAVLQARHCTTIRSTIEHMVLQFINCHEVEELDDTDSKDSIKKSQCNFITLTTWYKERIKGKSPKKKPHKKLKQAHGLPPLVVVIPNLEGFSPQILQNFILIASGYVQSLPLVLVFGVATAMSALHRSVPHHVSSKLRNQVFCSRPSVSYLNHVLEKVLLTSSCPFHLDEKTFKMLCDIFLFHDFSVHGFIQGFKFCMMEHYIDSSWKVLCCPLSGLSNAAKNLSKEDLEDLRQLPSFRSYVDTLPKKEKAPLLLDDAHFKVVIVKLMKDLHTYLDNFHIALRCLHVRELYSLSVGKNICETIQFKECFQLLAFQSREELECKLTDILSIVKGTNLDNVEQTISEYIKNINDVTSKAKENSLKSPTKVDIGGNLNRFQLKEKLMELSHKEKPLTLYEELRKKVLKYLSGTVFSQYLVPSTTIPLFEVFFFRNVSNVKRLIMGTPRAAIHTALNRPHFYLQCECCKSDAIVPSLPDICILYKLHLECGKLINMYDWLQAFLAVVSPNESGEEQRDVAPELQARFTRAVAELQFLGFIKSSRKKTDHVMRLTWGAA
ncbi:Origin recognition complex subunit 3 [Blattella germanica]|nr:Origin recognition complex subunit 3 [Blattella germanica]